MSGFSPRFLHAVVAEIDSVERRINRLDQRIERAKRQSTKDRLRAEREGLDRYARWLRKFLR